MVVRSTPTEDGQTENVVAQPPEDLLAQVQADADRLGTEPLAELPPGAIGATMFDLPGSADGAVTVLLPRGNVQKAPSQALVRIKSRDGRSYLGIVTAGPFAEPDNLRGDSPLIVTVTAQGGIFLPPFHGRVQVAILGEELDNGTVIPPQLRPLPNSPVLVLKDDEAARVLRSEGDIRLGLVVGYGDVKVKVPSDKKEVLPRHTAILGTTGGGKSTTVAGLVQQAQAAGMAVIILDVEPEYTHLHEPADNAKMLTALAERGMKPFGLPTNKMTLYHLAGRDTGNPRHPNRREFSLQFARLSPYTIMEMLAMNDAQQDRFLQAYEIAKGVLSDVGIFPQRGKPKEELDRQERIILRLDEFERGHPRLTLSLLLDVVDACLAAVSKGSPKTWNNELRTEEGQKSLRKRIEAADKLTSASSWGKVKSLLWRLHRLKVFDRHTANGPRFLDYQELLEPGRVSVVDLSDAGLTELSNFAIADLLRGVQEKQDQLYRAYEQAREKGHSAPRPPRVLIILEEAHEFLSRERIEQMPTLFQQVARIAKRGRKRWLSLVFVTQLPQHLPRQVFGLVNSYVLHKITDPEVVSTLQRTVSGIDEALWKRLPGLAPGQAIVSFPHMTRPLLVAVDPAPGKLRLVD
jgi:DNA helicase HerA-like ATPase